MVDGQSNESAGREALKRLGTSLCDRYHIVRLIGLGGMAAVYAGKHRNGHPVAIKVMHERFRDSSVETSFRREARLANRVAHPVVVPVIDDDVTEDGCVFLVMPLLRGETVRSRSSRLGGKLPLPEVLTIGHWILEALGAAHEQKIVHRDIKPENIFIEAGGAVRLLDFGIGRVAGGDDGRMSTHAGRVIGTPAFMAPEQALARTSEIDARTDVWALGATLFTLLSGRLVHEGATSAEITARTATRPAVPIGEVAPKVPGPVRDLVDRALRFERGERWPTAVAMNDALGVACISALGRPPAALPAITAPPESDAASISTAPTAAPPDGTPRTTGRPVEGTGVAVGTTEFATAASLPGADAAAGTADDSPQTGPAPSARGLRHRGAGAWAAAVIVLLVVTLGAGIVRQRRETTAASGDLASRETTVSATTIMPTPSVTPPSTSDAPQPEAPTNIPPRIQPPPLTARARPAVAPVARPASPAVQTAAPAPRAKCNPPYTVDSAGHHVYNAECD